MSDDKFSWEKFNSMPLIGIIRGLPESTILKITEVFVDVGFTNLEVTMNTPGVATITSKLRKEFPNINIGIGTVRSLADLEIALDAGSQYIVTPITDKSVIEECVNKQTPIFPGAYSPTEIYNAWTWGASAVKVFPANDLGPSYLKNVAAPLDDIKMIPTGGVNKENIKSFFEAGAVGVGLGGKLFNKEHIAKNDFKALKEHFIKFKIEMDKALDQRSKLS